MKVTPNNRHEVVECLKDLKDKIGNNDVLEFNYTVNRDKDIVTINCDWIIKDAKE